MTWKELKEFANSLPENELDKKVILWREDEAITINPQRKPTYFSRWMNLVNNFV